MKGVLRLIVSLLVVLVGGVGAMPTPTAMAIAPPQSPGLVAGATSDLGSTQGRPLNYDGPVRAYDVAAHSAPMRSDPAVGPRTVVERLGWDVRQYASVLSVAVAADSASSDLSAFGNRAGPRAPASVRYGRGSGWDAHTPETSHTNGRVDLC